MAQERDSKRSHAQERAAIQRMQMREREQRLRQMQEQYAKFGERVVALVVQAASRENELRRLVHCVTGRVVTHPERQHEVLLDFLNRHGEAVFLRESKAWTTPFANTPGADRGPRAAVVMPGSEDEAESPNRTPLPVVPPPSKDAPRVRLPDGREIPERRSGIERRRSRDRRAAMNIIYKNRRYGGDRRKNGDRRRRKAA